MEEKENEKDEKEKDEEEKKKVHLTEYFSLMKLLRIYFSYFQTLWFGIFMFSSY